MASALHARLGLRAALLAAAVFVATFAVAGVAHADDAPTNPANPATPATVTADALPAPQIDGVVWTQSVSGHTVFVGGNFAKARPAGAAPGVKTVARSNLLSYDAGTGLLNTNFAPAVNGQVRAVAASADGKRLYIGGSFTAIGSTKRLHVAELNPTTGAVMTAFNAAPNNSVNALYVRSTTVWMGGAFTGLGKSTRTHFAAVDITTGAAKPIHAEISGGDVNAITLSPDSTKVVIGGTFTLVNRVGNPGYGLAALNTTTGAPLPWNVNSVVRDAGADSGITSLTADSTGLYGSGYVYGSGGDLEGTFRADWSKGALTWLEDCHGDTYSTAVTSGALYVAGHAHDCARIGGFPETYPQSHYRAIAFSKAVTQKVAWSDGAGGYTNFGGEPAPSLLDWFPTFDAGTFTGLVQGPWSVATGDGYVFYGGEFTTVNGTPQQGLVRFTTRAAAPKKVGPALSGAYLVPTATSTAAGSATISWPADYDQDNATLRYQVYRDGDWSTPVFTATVDSTFWSRPVVSFVDTGLTPGTTHTYRVRVTDPDGNQVQGDSATVTVQSDAASSTATDPSPTPSATDATTPAG